MSFPLSKAMQDYLMRQQEIEAHQYDAERFVKDDAAYVAYTSNSTVSLDGWFDKQDLERIIAGLD
jgi:hypothetical protein